MTMITAEYIEDRIVGAAGREDAESLNITYGELRALLNSARDRLTLLDQITEYQIEIQRLEKLSSEA